LPFKDFGAAWTGFSQFFRGVADVPGATVVGTLDDEEAMVGTSPLGCPWTCYVIAEARIARASKPSATFSGPSRAANSASGGTHGPRAGNSSALTPPALSRA